MRSIICKTCCKTIMQHVMQRPVTSNTQGYISTVIRTIKNIQRGYVDLFCRKSIKDKSPHQLVALIEHPALYPAHGFTAQTFSGTSRP